MKRFTSKTVCVAMTMLVASSCAHGHAASVIGERGTPSGSASAEDSLCNVLVRNAYDVPIEAGARAGAEEVSLGRVDPDEAVEFGVPCSYRAVTVFRVVHQGPEADLRLSSRARALDPRRTTTVILRPAAARASWTPRA